MIDAAHDLLAVVVRFNDALNARDIDAAMQLMSEDCIFENTYPAPAGTRYSGQAAVRGFWEDFMRGSIAARFEIEEVFGTADRVVMLWRYHWLDRQEQAGHLRGVDVYKIRDGLIAEKLSYVKG
jgi:ketosteroid isomerase-like protein